MWEHKHDLIDGFTKQCCCHRLVYYESYDAVETAIDREKQLKRWSCVKKEWLIEQQNRTWGDLAADWFTKHRYQPENQVSPRSS